MVRRRRGGAALVVAGTPRVNNAPMAVIRRGVNNNNNNRTLVLNPNSNIPPPLNVQLVPTPARRRRRRNTMGNGNNSLVRSSAPVQAGTSWIQRPPQYSGAGPGALVITHEEPYATVPAGNFESFREPMIPNQFPWLNGVASNFSRFRWRKIEAYYQSASDTGVNGEISLGWMFDWDAEPQDSTEAQSMHRTVVCPPWSNLCLPTTVDTNRFSKTSYPYITQSQYDGMDPNDVISYVPTWLVIGRYASGSQNVGRIRVRYTIELMNPIPSRMNGVTAAIARRSLKMAVVTSDVPPKDGVDRLVDGITNLIERVSVDSRLTAPVIWPPTGEDPLPGIHSQFEVAEPIKEEDAE